MSQTDETLQITNSINVTDEDIQDFETLNQQGVKIVAQMVPNDKAENFMSLIKDKN